MTSLKIVCTLVLVFSFLSVLSLAVLWRAQVTTQRRLDRCVQQTAIQLKKIQNGIETSNLRIELERKAIAVAMAVAPETLPALQMTLNAEVLFQEAQLRLWNLKQVEWISKRGCDGKSDYFFPLPSLSWTRGLPDTIGAQPLEWLGRNQKKLSIRLWKPPRRSSAAVEKAKKWGARYVQF
jgi:hypothetical protein